MQRLNFNGATYNEIIMAKKGLIKDNNTGEVVYPVTLPECVVQKVVKVELVDGKALELEGNKY